LYPPIVYRNLALLKFDKMKYAIFLFCALMITLSFFSCKKNPANPSCTGCNIDTTAKTDTSGSSGDFTDIYVAGFLSDGTKNHATYWKNGTAVTLSDKESQVVDITVDKGTVYAVGTIYQNSKFYAVYWANGVEHLLTNGDNNASAIAIYAGYAKTGPAATDVALRLFIAGHEYTGDPAPYNLSQAVYWDVYSSNPANVQKHIVAPAPSNALDITWPGGEPVVCGITATGITNVDALHGTATVWRQYATGSWYGKIGNGIGSDAQAMWPVIKPDSTIDYYTCGREVNANTGNAMATWWVNGTANHFTDGTNYEYATDIQVINGHVFACGAGNQGATGTRYIAKYWKGDGTEIKLTDGTNNAFATGIAVKGDNVLVCGYENVSGTIAIAKYWKNGVAVNLSDGVHNAVATAMYAK
jgi:hypothetical protein